MKEVTIKITVDELNIVLQSLGKMPLEAVFQVFAKLKTQGQEQISAPDETPNIDIEE